MTGCPRASVGMTVDLGQRSVREGPGEKEGGEGDDKVDRATI